MSSEIEKLQQAIDELGLWILTYPNTNIPPLIKEQAEVTLKLISRHCIDSGLTVPPQKVHKITNVELLQCPDCLVNVSPKRLEKHKLKCPKNNRAKTAKRSNAGNSNSKGSSNFGNHIPELKNERRLDGSFGTHQFREQGKFGSHSVFDNYGDESEP